MLWIPLQERRREEEQRKAQEILQKRRREIEEAEMLEAQKARPPARG